MDFLDFISVVSFFSVDEIDGNFLELRIEGWFLVLNRGNIKWYGWKK